LNYCKNRILAWFVVGLLAGCAGESPAPPEKPPESSSPSVAMRVLVVNEPEPVEAIERLSGEWAARSGGTLTAAEVAWEDAAKSESLDADLIIFPTRYLGELSVRGRLRPVRQNVLESETLDAADILPLARRDLVTWGGRVMALPLGVSLPTSGLIVEAAPAIGSQDRLGDLFDPDTMKPRITEPPFVAALARLKDSQPLCGDVPVLGTGDRLVGVTSTSRNAATAFKLLEWLASSEISAQLAASAPGTLPVRRSQLQSPAWYDAKLDAQERSELAQRIEHSFNSDKYVMIPRIPGVDRYMTSLDDAQRAVTERGVEPAAALAEAAAQWEAITDELGRDSQREAYAKHLGITEQ
jgi:maltose-binding protein MalE